MAVELSGCLLNGRYNVDKKIQSGYYGTTWLAIDKQQQSKEVCLKVSWITSYLPSLNSQVLLATKMQVCVRS